MLVTVDTGGTKTLIAAFSEDGTLTHKMRFPTPAREQEYVKLLEGVLRRNFTPDQVDAVVVALPGIIKDGVAVWCNNLGWENFKAQNALEGILGNTPVLIENDANLAGLAEARSLDPIPTSLLYVTVSTGIGTGIITNGKIDPGMRLSEGGRMLVEYDGRVQEWESFASGKAIYSAYRKLAKDIESAHQWRQIAHRISRGFLVCIPLLQPDVVVIGGSMGTYFDKFDKPLTQILQESLPPHIPCPPFRRAKHPEEAVVYGCYYYAIDYLSDQAT